MDKVTLGFSASAQVEWERIFNSIECALRPGGEFCDIRDYASKVAENIARLAGVFHAFEGYEGTEISVETLHAAATVVLWYSNEFVRLFSPPDPLQEAIKDAYELEDWFIQILRKRGWTQFPANFVLQFGPNKLRTKERLKWTLECLAGGGRISLYWQGKKRFIQLNQAYFEPVLQGQQPLGFPSLG